MPADAYIRVTQRGDDLELDFWVKPAAKSTARERRMATDLMWKMRQAMNGGLRGGPLSVPEHRM